MTAKTAVFNPQDRPVDKLPVIYGFNNGGSPGWYNGCLVAEDGAGLGGHLCSHESFMPSDLGVFPGARPDRHKTFQEYYPGGYRMEFVGYDQVQEHKGLSAARALNVQTNGEGAAMEDER